MFGDEQTVLPGDILKILRDLGIGLTNHSNWLKRLHRSIICCCDLPEDDLADDSHYRCKFGKWYYGDIEARLKALPLFDEVGNLHQRVHEEARNLLCSRKSGTEIPIEDYDRFIDVAQEFRVAVQNLQFSMFSQVCAVDHLTGVWNRHAMSYKLAQEQDRVRRSGQPCAIALIDFDYFKSINDRYGHLAGDEVLKVTIEFFTSKMRSYDQIFRFGGEEFLFAFPETGLEMATELLERLREEVKNLPITLSNGEVLNVTISVGLAQMDRHTNEQDIIQLADNALMSAKLAGRDCVHVWHH